MGPHTTLLDKGEANEQSHVTECDDAQKSVVWKADLGIYNYFICEKECSCNISINKMDFAD